MAHLPRLILSYFLLIGVHASVSHGSPLPPTYNTSICSKSYKCGVVDISYPFYLSNAIGETYDYASFSCGYTDLKIFCSWDGRNETPTIQLGGDNYTVLNIFYDNLTIVLADTDALRGGSCPRVRHNVTFGQAYEWLQYTGSPDSLTFFFGCKLNLAPPIDPRLVSFADQFQINCKTFSNGPDGGDSFVFTSGELEAPVESELARRCSQVIVVPVNGSILNSSNQSALPSGGYGEVLNKGFDLAWTSRKDGQCYQCEKFQGQCAYSQNRIFLSCLCSDGKVRSQGCRNTSSTMPLVLSRRRWLLLLLLVAASHGDASDDTYDTSMCLQKSTTCGNVNISYPFYFSDKTRDINGSSNSYCGYPGLAIDCDDGKPTLQLNGTEKYKVNYINYGSITNVSLLDQEVVDGSSGCPRVDHNVTFAQGSWLFFPGMSVDYLVFFLGCSITNLFLPRENTGPIPCSFVGLTGDSYVLPKDQVPPGNWSHFCDKTFEVPVLKYQPMDPKGDAWRKGGYGQVLRQGFPLSLNDSMKPAHCTQCEQSKGRCGFNQAGEFVSCMCPNGQVRSLRVFKLREEKETILKKYRYRRISKGTPRIESFLQRNGTLHPKRYTYAEVKRMTKSFAEKLGKGGFGAVYRGNLSDGRQVAVKMLKDSKGDGEEFINEVASISRTSHVNVVTLLGFCLHGSKRALIYEYMPNGSLERYAFRENSKGELSLSWEKLFDVAVGIARGLEYLHRGCNTRIVHFDIKPHNILLDQEFCPKISDFGMAKLCANKESIISIAGARGTIGYIAPEVYSKQFGAISSKSDVYSYGMMILEMVGARERNIDANNEYCISSSEIDGETTELVRKMIVVALWCIQVVPTNRPTMTRVVEMLEGSTSAMARLPRLLLFLFFLLLHLHLHAPVSHGSTVELPETYDPSICSKSYNCGGVEIKYPFYLSNTTTPYICGYTDLKITCLENTPTIQLGGRNKYNHIIQNIFYDNRTVKLADTDALSGGTCPRVSHNVTLDGKWLHYTTSNDSLTFFFDYNPIPAPTDPSQGKPSPNQGPQQPSAATDKYQIRCKDDSINMSNGLHFVLISGEINASIENELLATRKCGQIIVSPVHRGALVNTSGQSLASGRYSRVLRDGFEVAWNSSIDERCYPCEQSKGHCSYQNNTFIRCLCSNGRVRIQDCKPNIVAGVSSVLLLCLLFACFYGHNKYRSKQIATGIPRIESLIEKNGTLHPKRYTYNEVKRMTKSFAEKLGQGGFGAVYRGNLFDGRQVAVKMLKDFMGDGEEFINEVASISRTSHVNVVSLLGFCLQGSKRALIYEFMPNVGIARGLEYLHRGCNTRIVHFDIKPHNILLDQEFCPKISDFGMAKLCANKESTISLTGARGTIGYIAP
uniref:Protein kinase domain-containing protein n=1 Tax=Oryza punctata TaxID=4537 RepID=A0A0E0JMP6_ORYPU